MTEELKFDESEVPNMPSPIMNNMGDHRRRREAFKYTMKNQKGGDTMRASNGYRELLNIERNNKDKWLERVKATQTEGRLISQSNRSDEFNTHREYDIQKSADYKDTLCALHGDEQGLKMHEKWVKKNAKRAAKKVAKRNKK